MSVEVLAKNARSGSRRLCGLEAEARADIIRHLASSLLSSHAEIMEANDRDLRGARARGGEWGLENLAVSSWICKH